MPLSQRLQINSRIDGHIEMRYAAIHADAAAHAPLPPMSTTEPAAIDEALIDRLVRTFYARARQDPLLGPVFEARITDWEPHLRTIIDFWSGVMLKTGRYQGNPMRLHVALPIGDEHFARWIQLFTETAEELGGAEAAEAFGARAKLIGESLKLGIGANKGQYRRRT